MNPLASRQIVARLPSERSGKRDEIPTDMTGATIVGIGSPRKVNSLCDAGLIIDYIPRNSRKICRIVLGFDEREMRITYQGLAEAPDVSRR
jgi:hypothetical protein